MDKKFDAVILSGGGIKGIGTLGVLHYYFEKGLLDLSHVQEFSGTSVGTIINLFMICGYTPMEIFIKVYTLNNLFKAGDLENLWKTFQNYGIMPIKPLMDIMEEMVTDKLGVLPTLLELYTLTKKTLTITAVNHSKMRIEYINHKTRPHLSAIEAVKFSCNLPIIFPKIEYDGDYWVDGGLVDNFPYDGLQNPKANILGVVVMGTDKEENADTFIGYVYRLIVIPINTMTQLRTKDLPKNVKLVTLTFDGVPMLNFGMASEKKMDMFTKGYHTARRDEEREILMIKGWSPEKKILEWNDSASSWNDGWETEQFDKDK